MKKRKQQKWEDKGKREGKGGGATEGRRLEGRGSSRMGPAECHVAAEGLHRTQSVQYIVLSIYEQVGSPGKQAMTREARKEEEEHQENAQGDLGGASHGPLR